MPDEPTQQLDDLDYGKTVRGHQPGDVLFQRFKLSRMVARGGMGVIWQAEDQRLERVVALKLLPEFIGNDAQALQQLRSETKRGLELAHPNIVRVYDFVEAEAQAAISMEFVDGETLSQKRQALPQQVFQPDILRPLLLQLLDAFEYAHSTVGLVHRDIKPANLLVDKRNLVKVTDFGIARTVRDSMLRITSESVSPLSGTLAYMSPQQASGEPAHATDDIYALGATLYELLTTKPPFYSGDIGMQLKSQRPASVQRRREEFGIDLPPIPESWEKIVAACLAKEADERPQSMAEIKATLQAEPAPSAQSSTTALSMPAPSSAAKPKAERNAEPQPQKAAKAPRAAAPGKAGHPLWMDVAAILIALVGLGAGAWYAYQLWFVPTEAPAVVELAGPVDEPQPQLERVEPPVVVEAIPSPTPQAEVVEPPKPDQIVPDTHPTIQQAIASAQPGQVILVRAGRYEESLNLRAGITIEGESPGKVIVVSPSIRNPALRGLAIENVTIKNMVFQHPEADWDESVSTTVVEIQACQRIRFIRCAIQNGNMTGLGINGQADVYLEHCEVSNNGASGVELTAASRIRVVASRLASNQEQGLLAVGPGTVAEIYHSEATENRQSGAAGADGATVRVIGSRLQKNQEAGLFVELGSPAGPTRAVVVGSRLQENDRYGVALQDKAVLEMYGSLVSDNKSNGMLLSEPGSGVRIENSSLRANALDGIVIHMLSPEGESPELRIQNNLIEEQGGFGIALLGKRAQPFVSGNSGQNFKGPMNFQEGAGVRMDE